MGLKRNQVNPHAGPDEVLREFAKIGLRHVMIANQRAKWRLEQAMRELADREQQAATVAQIVGDPLAEEREQMEQLQQHREYMRQQREGERARQQEPFFPPFAVTSR
jgi:hypothetical protein